MIPGIFGRKIKQTRHFTEDGTRIPVTLIEIGPCTVVQVKTRKKDGYKAIQLGFGTKKSKNVSKPVLGHVKKARLKQAPRFLRELRVKRQNDGLLKQGSVITASDVFEVGDLINITGISKGKGFAGVVKRHGFRGGPRTHGQSDRERAPGSIGQTTTPGRVYKGKRMAGRMGTQQVTIKNSKVVTIDEKKNILIVKGLVPGPRGGLLRMVKAAKAKKTHSKFEEDKKE